MTPPPTPERMAEIRAHVEMQPKWGAYDREMLLELLREVDRLEAELAEAKRWGQSLLAKLDEPGGL